MLRYVREWLGLMVVGHVVEVDIEGHQFFLPRHRRPILTGQSKLSLVGMFTGILYASVKVTPELIDCFKTDGPRGQTILVYLVY